MAPRRLYRSNRERILGGVAGGIGEYFDVDPTLVRLAWIVLAIAGGFGVLAYIVAWIVIPEAPWRTRSARDERGRKSAGDDAAAASSAGAGGMPSASLEDDDEDDHRHRYSNYSGAWIFGALLVGLGLFLLVRNFAPFLWVVPFWPVLLILVGGLLLAGAFRHERNDDRRERKDQK